MDLHPLKAVEIPDDVRSPVAVSYDSDVEHMTSACNSMISEK
jgi:hypothetical protein